MDSCNIGSWNVRGLNNKVKQDSVVEFCNVNKIGVGGLLETKLKGVKVQELMDNKFANWDFFNSSTVEGRLLIICRKGYVRVTVIVESPQHVHCVVKMAGQASAFCLTFVYGYNTIEERKSLWNNLVQLKFPVSSWLILGDFNSVFNVDDRNGGNPITHNEMADSNHWLSQVHIEALKSHGSVFTWTNNQAGTNRIYSKIDHIFVNEEWHDHFPNSAARFSWESISDHCSCVVSTTTLEAIGIKPFRYYNFWANHPEFKSLVEQNWKKPLSARGLKGEAKACYSEAKLQAQSHPKDKIYQEQESNAAANFFAQEKIYMGSISTVKIRLNLVCIEQGSKLSLDDQLGLLKPFLYKEVKRAMFSIPDTKSPGPDGFGSGLMPPELHNTMISLIPKLENPAKAVDYRPIACCTMIYKCISKLLCSRLASVLPSLVNQNQGAFIQGRSIAHNVMILQDILKNYRRKNTSPHCTIKIDISKAYDTVDWNFIEDLLNALNFPSRFVQLIMICIKSTSYSLLMNGRIQGGFHGAKGLRQGDPLSRLIFVLIMDYLSRNLLHAVQDSKFRYHPLYKSLKLINLCFADDLILLSKGTKQSIKVLKEVLDDFSNTTGLHINVNKSQIFFGGVETREKEEIIMDLGLAEGDFPLKYLGVPLRPTKWKAEDCGIIIKKIKMRLHSWGSWHPSFAGKVQLIHSILLGLRNYWMSTFILPQSVSKEIEKLCRGFLWGLNGNRSRIHLASWEKVCLPKAFGGLGFKEGTKWNQAILTKYIWAITEKRDLLWVKWVHTVYLKGVSFWSYELKLDSIWYWRKLCRLRQKFSMSEILKAGCSGKFCSSVLYNSFLPPTEVNYHRAIWSSLNLPKHRFFLWQVVNAHLLTKDNLSKFHIVLDSFLCPVCGVQPETHQRLFFNCCLSRRVVELVFNWLGFRGWPVEFDGWLSWISLKASCFVRQISIAVSAATCYGLWLNRNRCVFDGFSKSDTLIALYVKSIVSYRLIAIKSRKLSRQERDLIHRLTCS
ncbi:uncharacterized protein LOC133819045 [Humulus lupulus]|uniref:uncharacterized protein LOC133819045 n=1 Tax=Humulus lupulus TaxID=3486 RepID=UPI002B412172|nr:uncharacterized protein LOC133819045 [Humulus lupulus]